MTKKLNIGDYVWGKVEGYPWWPGTIKSLKKKLFEVLFFGDFSRAYLGEKSLKLIDDESMNVSKNDPNIQCCFEQIKRIKNGESSIEKEINKIEM